MTGTIDRAKKANFLRYMELNPFYFEDIFKRKYTPENAREEYYKIIGEIEKWQLKMGKKTIG